MVEQLTLNQRVPGSSPCWCTKRWPVGQAVKTAASHAANRSSILLRVTKQFNNHWLLARKSFNTMTGADDAKDPPVPIPNTEVKLGRADNTWMATSREDR